MKYILLCSVISLAACTSTPKLVEFDGPKALDRTDVIKGHKDCHEAGLRPNVEYLVQKTSYGKVLVPVNVHCEQYQTKGFLGYPEKR